MKTSLTVKIASYIIKYMNIQIQCCGLAILCVLCFFNFHRETVGFRGTRLYARAMAANFLCLILDISSISCIVSDGGTGSTLSVVIGKLYLASLICVFYFGFSYTCNDINTLQHSKLTLPLSTAFALVGCLLVAILPIHFIQRGEHITYSYGPSVMATNIFAMCFILGTLLMTIIFRKKMNPRRMRAVQIWMAIEICAGLIQFMSPSLLLIGFATAIGMMILFMELENPEGELDRVASVFSANIMHDYIRQLYEDHIPFSGVLIINASEWDVNRAEERAIFMEMANFLKAFPHCKVFRGTGNDFAIVMPQKYYSEQMVRSIYERFVLSWLGKEISTLLVAVPDNRVAATADEVTQFYQYYRSRMDSIDERLIFFGQAEADKLRMAKIIQAEIVSALDEDRVEVFYQPIYSFRKNCFVSAEALCRIRKPDGSVMMPGIFIPVAEKTGLVEALGTRVLEKVCEMLQEHPITEIGVEYIEVNLSVAQCENRWLTEDISQLIERFEIDPTLLNLEITETSTIRSRDMVIANMEKLTDLGFSLSLDDFGTGESNLNYIVDMPVQIVKFDRSMTKDYFRNEKTKLVMNSVVEMIRNMGLHIVVEGIEEKQQLDAMASIGVDYIQGYYFSKPLPLQEFLNFIHIKNLAVMKEA